MTVASMATVAACILIMSFSYCMVNNLQYMLAQLEDDIGIAAFMPSNTTAEQVENVKKEIEGIEHVTEVEYVSPDAALEDLKKELEEHPEYTNLQDLIDTEYIISLDNYKNSALSRFREAYNLMRKKEHASITDSLDLALELAFNSLLNPAIITACKNLDELDIYIDYLNSNEL